jgi:PRTRC genetic system protein B
MTTHFQTELSLFSAARTARAVEIVPEWALVCSRMTTTGHDSSMPSSIFTTHQIRTTGKDRYVLAEGSPTERAGAIELLGRIADVTMSLLPDTVIAHGPQGFAWSVRAAVRAMKFRHGKTRLHLTVPWPSLLLVATQHGLRVFARKAQGRPTFSEKLYHAPLPNIFREGFLCWGDIERPAVSLRAIPDYEHALFNTYFTTPNHNETLRGLTERNDLCAFWRTLHDNRSTEFPVERLCPFGQTVAEVCHA